MLSDEEKQSIESLKNIAIYMGDNYTFSQQGIRNLRENLRIVLSAIEKQSKEIEELKLKNEALGDITLYNQKNNDKKWGDKIKAKIEEWQKEKEFYDKDEDREWGQYNNWDWVDTIINEMQSLLDKE